MLFYSNRAVKSSFNKIVVAGSAAIIGALVLCSCGNQQEMVSTMTVDSEGQISYVIYEQFTEDYYNVDELSKMAQDEIDVYNSEYISRKIDLTGTELVEDDDRTFVRMSMTYDSFRDFSNFNQESLFYGTVSEAKEQGYKLSAALVDSKGERLPDSYFDDHGDRHILITNDRANIITPYNIEYMSNGVKLNGKKEADVSAVTADNVQLLLSK